MGEGPLELLAHGLADRVAARGYDVSVSEVEDPDLQDREIGRIFEINRRLAAAVQEAVAEGRRPVVLAGNCNASLGTTAAVGSGRLGVLWFDAHADFDIPEDNVSGFFDVMALATLTGSCWATLRRTIPGFREVGEDDVVLVGVRDLAEYQRDRLERSAVRVVYGGERRVFAIEEAVLPHIDALSQSIDVLYIHVDFDSLDDSYGRANEYAAPFGLRVEHLVRIVSAAASRIPVAAIAFTAYDPTLDDNERFLAVALRATEAVIAAVTRSSSRPSPKD
jgi:arginase